MNPRVMIRVIISVAILVQCFCLIANATQQKRPRGWSNLTTTRSRVEFLDDPRRVAENQVDRVVSKLRIKPGDVVADVGSGTGLYTFPLADKVGKNGKVYAVDILDDMLEFVRTKMQKEGVKNITLVKSTEADPRLPAASCDTILLANTYQHIGNKPKFLKKLRQSLKPGGSVAIISVTRSVKFKGLEKEVMSGMKTAGFQFAQKYDFLKGHMFLVFK